MMLSMSIGMAHDVEQMLKLNSFVRTINLI